MLLPESFRPVAPEALVAWDESAGAIAGLAAFHRIGRETVRTSVIAVRPYRRQGVGSSLLRRVAERARERGDERVRAEVDLTAHPEADTFLQANGFLRGPMVLQLEGDLAAFREPVLGLRARLAASGRIPANARIVEGREFPVCERERLYNELLASHLGGETEMAGYVVTRPDFDAIVLMAGDTPAGMLMGVRHDGNGVGTIRALAVAPPYRGGWGWANLLLLTGALDRGWEAGARRLRIETGESNWQVLKQSARAHAVILRRRARFVREVTKMTET